MAVTQRAGNLLGVQSIFEQRRGIAHLLLGEPASRHAAEGRAKTALESSRRQSHAPGQPANFEITAPRPLGELLDGKELGWICPAEYTIRLHLY